MFLPQAATEAEEHIVTVAVESVAVQNTVALNSCRGWAKPSTTNLWKDLFY
jgi:hypothetical protein